ncbi:putative nuclease HARBI1 [Acropora millepora]|uniref:putative nuclease HARBI1 n=1 Tax=Acropora millepora TaxID=45264 RepID=UPI001CF457E2|nr:putative nuclease HARBI1 [Acropora millepora]
MGIRLLANHSLLSDEIAPSTRRSHSFSATELVLVTLRFLASGSFLEVIGDTFLSYDKSTVSRVLRGVPLALASKVNDFVKFPTTPNERDKIKHGLFRVGGFPSAIGCIDGTHVRIKAPSQNEPDFINRKGFHSVNVQAICNHKGSFTNVVARWPGSTHDSHMFRTSAVCRLLEGQCGLEFGVLLGDSGYACTPFLMTPSPQPRTRSEEQFNRAHKTTPCIIERSFGLLKRRFHVLHSEIRMAPDRVCTIIVACIVLHNIAIRLREPEVDDGVVGEEE